MKLLNILFENKKDKYIGVRSTSSIDSDTGRHRTVYEYFPMGEVVEKVEKVIELLKKATTEYPADKLLKNSLKDFKQSRIDLIDYMEGEGLKEERKFFTGYRFVHKQDLKNNRLSTVKEFTTLGLLVQALDELIFALKKANKEYPRQKSINPFYLQIRKIKQELLYHFEDNGME
jgi:hypothetical protein